jgi:GAF domain-containing protein
MQDPALDASDAVVTNLEQRWNSVRNNDLINLAMHVIPSLLDADRCSLFLIQPETQDVWLEAGTGVKSRQITVGVHASMVGECILKGRSIRRDNLQSSEGAHQTVADQQNYLVTTALTVPIRPDDGVAVGALQALNSKRSIPSRWDLDDVGTVCAGTMVRRLSSSGPLWLPPSLRG